MRKYADFECKTCARQMNNLPLDAKRCPVCGKARGFKRLFNAVQISTRGHRAARWIDKRLDPAYAKHDAVKAGAKRFDEGIKEATARVYEQATPEVREEIVKHQNGMQSHRNVNAAAAYGMIDPQARRDSITHTYPATKRIVVPAWQR